MNGADERSIARVTQPGSGCGLDPFHPLGGQQLLCVEERYNRFRKMLLLEGDNGAICSIPPQWTDVVAPDPEIVLGGGRALFRVADLLELTRLIDQLGGHDESRR
jgi:hypothetical protein